MGFKNKSMDIIKNFGIDAEKLPKETADYLADKVTAMLQDEKSNREEFAAELASLSDADLEVFIPDVYQKSIYDIDYDKLKANGIKLISFDIDDTIDDSIWNKTRGAIPGVKVTMPKEAKDLFRYLKSMGFTVALITNTHAGIAQDVCEDLGADDYIAKAHKPETQSFVNMMEKYKIDSSQMAHVGNSIRDDIVGGNRAGVTTCLIRRAGYSLKVVKVVLKTLNLPTKGHLIREKLLERKLWRKHHVYHHGDQYYQLGETPKYKDAKQV